MQTPGFDGSQGGSEIDFGTPLSLGGIDAMIRAGDGANLASYPAQQIGMGHGHPSTLDPALHSQNPLASGQRQQGFAGNGRQGRMGESENTSPDMDMDMFDGTENNDASAQRRQSENADGADGELRPSWSELKTKAGKERKRLPLACIACRRKKIRCSGEKPACKHCLRSRIPCVYKVTTRKAAPRTDYMAMLDKRLKRMEERVIKVIPKEEQGIVLSTGRATLKPPLPPAPSKGTNASKKRMAETAFADELNQWAASKDVLPDRKTPTTAEPDKGSSQAQAQASDEYNLLREGADKLPSRELQEHLSEVFFDSVYCQSYPLLHKPSFMRKLAQGQVAPVLMLAVCAMSARFSTHPAFRSEQPAFLRGETWASAAREIALKRYDTPNITILIVYLILGLHEFGTCQGGRSWMFGGMAQRMAYALQLHKDLDHDPKTRNAAEKSELTFTDREIRRRTMWSCFLMDRFNSSGTERPIFISEQYIRAQLPIKESYFQMEITGPTEDLEGNVPNPVEPSTGQVSNAKDNMGVTAYLIRLVAIWGRLINYMNLGGQQLDEHPMWDAQSKFHQIKQAVKDWRDALPASMEYTPENLQNHASEKIANQFLFLHLVHNQIVLFINRFALPTPGSKARPPKEMPAEFLSEAKKTALEAANQISKLVHEAMDYQVVAPFAGYCAFYSSTVHIYGAFSNNAALEALSKQNLACNIKYLTKMKKYWGMFHFVTENLRDLYRRHADAAKPGSKGGVGGAAPKDNNGDQTIFQYGDWFDRYPHGVSGTDYEEPSAETKKEPGADAVLGQKSDLQTVEEFFSKMSPPSAAAAQKDAQQQQPQSRKMAKKRQTKAQSKPSQDSQAAAAAPTAPHGAASNDEMQAFASSLPDFTQPSTGFGMPSQQQQQLMGTMPSHQQFLSQLDRQIVLDSYAGLDNYTSHPMLGLGGQQQQPQPQQLDDLGNFDFAGLAPTDSISPEGAGGGNLFPDTSMAWFMPFNMEPPPAAGGEDGGNLFAGTNFDWSPFGNPGAELQGTGLTPGVDLGVGGEPGGPTDGAGRAGGHLDVLEDLR